MHFSSPRFYGYGLRDGKRRSIEVDNFYRGQITLVVVLARSMNLNGRRSKYNDSVQITNRERKREESESCVKIEIYDAVTRIGTNYHPEATSIPLVMAKKKTDPPIRDRTTRPLH